MFNAYKKLFSIPGAINFSAAAFLGRLPAGMIGLAIMLPISSTTSSYATAGLVVACTMGGMALCAPISGRLIDSYGQAQVLMISVILNFMSTLALIYFIWKAASVILMCLAGVFAGLSRLSTGTMARTRWAHIIAKHRKNHELDSLQAAYAFESVLDEIVFISAPILATVMCLYVHPLAGLWCCLVFYLMGALTLAILRDTQPPTEMVDGSRPFVIMVKALQVVFLATFLIGVSAGSIEVNVIARAYAMRAEMWIGFFMAILAFSSMMSGFWYGSHSFKLSLFSIWARCLSFLFIVLPFFLLVDSVLTLMLTLFLVGLLIAPISIVAQLIVKKILPRQSLTEGISLVVTAMIAGMAVGYWCSGLVVDGFGVGFVGSVPIISTLMATLTVIYNRKILLERSVHEIIK